MTTTTLIDTLFEGTNDGLLLVDRELEIVRANNTAHLLLRARDVGLAGRSLRDILPFDPTMPIERELDRALSQEVSVEFDVFYPQLYVWHEIRAVPAPEGLLLVLRDITDRQWLLRNEAERAYLRNLFEEAPVAITLKRGRQLRYEYLNKAARQLIGGRSVEGKTIREAFPELEGQGHFELMEQVYTTGKSYQAMAQPVHFARTPGGPVVETYFTFMYQAVRGFDAQVSGVLTIAYEVAAPEESEQKQAGSPSAANKAATESKP